MVVGNVISYPDVIDAFEKSEKTLARAINPTVCNHDELQRSKFLSRVLKQPRIFLIGSDDDIKAPR